MMLQAFILNVSNFGFLLLAVSQHSEGKDLGHFTLPRTFLGSHLQRSGALAPAFFSKGPVFHIGVVNSVHYQNGALLFPVEIGFNILNVLITTRKNL